MLQIPFCPEYTVTGYFVVFLASVVAAVRQVRSYAVKGHSLKDKRGGLYIAVSYLHFLVIQVNDASS